jgi:hypothetical protein
MGGRRRRARLRISLCRDALLGHRGGSDDRAVRPSRLCGDRSQPRGGTRLLHPVHQQLLPQLRSLDRSPRRPLATPHGHAGLLGALAYYTKLSEILLVPLFPVTAFLVAGPSVARQRWAYAGWAVLALGILPWQLSNLYHFGSPIHGIHNYASGFIGLAEWESTHYRAYWNRDLPRTSDRWTKYADRWELLSSRQREEYVRLALLGSGTGQADWYKFGPLGVGAFALLRGEDIQPSLTHVKPDPSLHKAWIDRSQDPDASRRAAAGWRSYWSRSGSEVWSALTSGWRETLRFLSKEHRSTMLPNLLGAAYVICVLIGVPLRAILRGTFRAELREWPRAWGIVAALTLLGVVHGTLLIYFFSVSGSFSFPALPIMAVLGLAGVAAVARRIARPLYAMIARRWPRRRSVRPYLGCVATSMICAWLLLFAATHAHALGEWQQAALGVKRRLLASGTETLADWVASQLSPNAVIMARNPWELRFFSPSGIKTVAMPSSPDARETLGIAYYYGVTHILRDASRPALNRYLDALPPGISEIDAPARLYAIDWTAVPLGDVRLPHETDDARLRLPAATVQGAGDRS